MTGWQKTPPAPSALPRKNGKSWPGSSCLALLRQKDPQHTFTPRACASPSHAQPELHLLLPLSGFHRLPSSDLGSLCPPRGSALPSSRLTISHPVRLHALGSWRPVMYWAPAGAQRTKPKFHEDTSTKTFNWWKQQGPFRIRGTLSGGSRGCSAQKGGCHVGPHWHAMQQGGRISPQS